MQCLKIELHAVTAVTAVVVVMMMAVAAAALYLLMEIKKSRTMILQGEN
jgi:hypothetical protein